MAETGDQRDAWMPNPDCVSFDRYEFVGQLMAGAIQTMETIAVKWPGFVWKKIARFPCSVEDYCTGIDESVARYSHVADVASQDEFELSYGETFTFSMNNSNDTAVELIPGGGVIEVTYVHRHEFVDSLVAMRVREVDAQCEAIRRGLLKACIPAPVLGLWSVQEFQLAVCGKPEILIDELKKQVLPSRAG